MAALLALVDCNNFYVSCERAFRPDLAGKPVVVLSNNDGCIVARSQEVKDLGIKMGVPLFQVQALVRQHKIQLFSSNYTLYADMSARVMTLLAEFSPRLEVYSIDEAFLDISGIPTDARTYALSIKERVFRATGIPVCVGMGPTKTLAKLANYAAKKWPQTSGVVDLSDPVRREKLMRIVPVNEVWGIGTQTTKRLNQAGIFSVWELATHSPKTLQAQFSVVLARTVLELRGTPCLDLEAVAPDKQQIVCSRSFGQRLTEYHAVSHALSTYCLRAAEKLRNQHSVTGHITVFIRTSPFKPDVPHYQRSAALTLSAATQDSRVIVKLANQLLKTIYKPGHAYQKCGVQLSNIQPESLPGQIDLFAQSNPSEGNPVMTVFDQINWRFPNAIGLAAAGVDKHWKPTCKHLSPRYTTDWNQLMTVNCH